MNCITVCLEECSRFCHWFSLQCLVPWNNHLPSVQQPIFRHIGLFNRWYICTFSYLQQLACKFSTVERKLPLIFPAFYMSIHTILSFPMIFLIFPFYSPVFLVLCTSILLGLIQLRPWVHSQPELWQSDIVIVLEGAYQNCPPVGRRAHVMHREQSRYALSQWETSLQCNDVSQWLGAYLDWFLHAYHPDNSSGRILQNIVP